MQRWNLDWNIRNCAQSLFLMAMYYDHQYQYFISKRLTPEEAKKFAWAAYNRGKHGVAAGDRWRRCRTRLERDQWCREPRVEKTT